ncbi:MAG: NAD(P)-dependent oxidoreductase [Candidatus Saccharimonadales bacterium]
MDDATFVILGANGQLGTALRAQYPNARALDSSQLDITDADAITGFDWSTVSTILNAAAYTNVDGAETAEGRAAAWQVNAVGARNLAAAAAVHDICLVHISSDYVFDGSHENHAETESFTPLSVYGQTKAAADLAVSLVPKHYILRTTWVIGDGKNFVRTMIGLGQKGISPTVVSDQVGRLTFTDELVRSIDHLLSTTAPYSTYNATNDGTPASWADITREIFTEGGFDLTVTDATTAEYFLGKADIAPRPLNSVMDLRKLQATGFNSTDWHTELKDYIQKELAQ